MIEPATARDAPETGGVEHRAGEGGAGAGDREGHHQRYA